MNKITISLLLIGCLIMTTVQCQKFLNKDNRERVEKLILRYANTFIKQYGAISMIGMSIFQNFEDIKYNNLRINLVPEDEEEKIYKGQLDVEGLSFGLVSTIDGDSERVQVEIPNLTLSFNLFSNNGFLSIDDLVFDQENEGYQSYANTISQLINMAIMKNLGHVYNVLHNEALDEQAFEENILKIFEEKYNLFYEGKEQEEEEQNNNKAERKPFKFDVNKYFNKKAKPERKYDQEIVINSLEDLENLTINLNVGRVDARPQNSDSKPEISDSKPQTSDL